MCDFPRIAYPVEGGISFDKPRGHSGNTIQIPCKMCIGCRLQYRTDWSTRMMCENQMHEESHFVTLTYDPENLPENADLHQEDMQRFFKRLRKKIEPQKIRYVYSGEYGERYSRPHFHAIIYGLTIPDLVFTDTNDRGDKLYGSEFLSRIWGNGFISIGAVTSQSCGYVAGYMLKDSNGNYDKRNPYLIIDPDTGEMVERKRPFARFSTTPGIGRAWLEKYPNSVQDDCVRQLDGSIRPLPQYFFDQLEKIKPELHEEIKLKRESSLNDPHVLWNNTPSRKAVRAQCREAKMNLSKRGTQIKIQNYNFITGQDYGS